MPTHPNGLQLGMRHELQASAVQPQQSTQPRSVASRRRAKGKSAAICTLRMLCPTSAHRLYGCS